MMLVKVPLENGLGHTVGCRKGGNAIIATLDEIWTNEQGKEIDRAVLDLEEIHLDNNNLEEAGKLIYENAFETIESQDKTIFLGGDHSMSFPIGKAFLDVCKEENKKGKNSEPFLIVFDSHPDLMAPGKEPNHEEWLRALVEYGFPAENIILIGLRNSDLTELDFIKKNKIRVYNMASLMDIENICDVVMEQANKKQIYLSIDIDSVDPRFAPGTGYIEPGGMTSRELLYFIQRINLIKTLRVVDIVEINPDKDKKYDNMTIKLGAKILAEFL